MVIIILKNKCFIFNIVICVIRGEKGGKNKIYLLKKGKKYYVILVVGFFLLIIFWEFLNIEIYN